MTFKHQLLKIKSFSFETIHQLECQELISGFRLSLEDDKRFFTHGFTSEKKMFRIKTKSRLWLEAKRCQGHFGSRDKF